MIVRHRSARLSALLLLSPMTGAAAQTASAPPARTQAQADDDMLEPLTPAPKAADKAGLPPAGNPQDDDMLEPLTPAPQAGKAGLPPVGIPEDDDLLRPLEPVAAPKPSRRPSRPVNLDVAEYERQLAEAEAERARRNARKDGKRTILVERWYTDGCGSFSVSWGGTKTCEPLKRRKWELVEVDDDAAGKKDGETSVERGTAPRDRLAGMPADAGRPSSSPLGGGAPPDSAPGAGGAPAPSVPASAGIPGKGATVAERPAANGFRDTGPFAVRVDSAQRGVDGSIDLIVTFITRTAAPMLVGNGDWRAFVTDSDGVSTDHTALYRPGTGVLQPFDRMPRASNAVPAQARFHLSVPDGMAAIRSASVMFAGGAVATFPIPTIGVDGPALSSVAPGASAILKRFEVRYQALTTVGHTTELVFSARNVTAQPQFAHGTRLQFLGRGKGGEPIDATGRIYAARGPVGQHLEGVSVLPGQTARFRVVFDSPDVLGPIEVRDDVSSAALAMPPIAEPIW